MLRLNLLHWYSSNQISLNTYTSYKLTQKMEVLEMVEFETLKTNEIKFGNNKFLEVARKIARTEEGGNEFISISKGYITPNDQKRFKNALGFPADQEILNGLIEALQGIMEGAQAETPAEETTEEPAEEEKKEEAPSEETKEE